MAKILTPLLRKLLSLSSTKLIFRCRCEGFVECYSTDKNGHSFEKECKPKGISTDIKEECSVEKNSSCVPAQNTSAASSTFKNNNCQPVLKDRGSETPETVSEDTGMLQCKCDQCNGAPSMASVAQDKPTKWNSPPEVPTNCCMTGCPNCVWLKFAEDMMEFSAEGGADARKIIEEIDDPNLRTFLLLELDNMQKP